MDQQVTQSVCVCVSGGRKRGVGEKRGVHLLSFLLDSLHSCFGIKLDFWECLPQDS